MEVFREAFAKFMRRSLRQSRRLPPEVLDGLKELGEMQDLEEVASVYEGSIDRAVAKARNESKLEGRREGKLEGRLEGKLETLNRLTLKKFGAAGQGELPALVAGIRGDSQLDDAFDYLLECRDADQFAGFLRRASNGS